ncbi:MAG: choice-of-anchor B family protein [Olleya sp.]
MTLKKVLFFTVFSILIFSCSKNEINTDQDNDGIEDVIDNCPLIANPNQEDTDEDGIGDVCDDFNDKDNDGVEDALDNCPDTPNPNQEDSDNDGMGDVCSGFLDSDNDGIEDTLDNCPDTPNPNQEDFDQDGIGDLCDANPTNIVFCENGFADGYPCNGYDLLARIDLATLDPFTTNSNALSGNDSWGWTDPTTNKEYALVGLNSGVSFVDISQPTKPLVVGFLPTATVNSDWRDVKVYNNYAFIVSEASNHGMQVFDLSKLRNVTNTPQTFTADATYTGFGSAHNIVINQTEGYAYPVGTTRSGTYKGGPLFINIQNPLSPIDEGGFLNYAHDAQVVTYNGPDTEHLGKEILIGSNETEVVIVDISDKGRPIKLSSISYQNVHYTHQGWFTEDFKYFLLGDELDELRAGNKTRTIVFDFTDLDNPKHHVDYITNNAAIDHNGYVKGNLFYQASYTAGVRIVDLSSIDNKNLTEVGYFDTFPASDATSFNGVWNVYPYFESGVIVVSDIERGLFLIKKSE